MKKIVSMLAFLLAPLAIFAATQFEVPAEAKDALDTIVNNTAPNVIVLSGVIVTVVQVLKKLLATFKIEISGIKSQLLALGIAVAYAVFNLTVWDDGQLSKQDIVTIIEAVVSAVGGIYGYKILWRTPSTTETNTEKKEETK